MSTLNKPKHFLLMTLFSLTLNFARAFLRPFLWIFHTFSARTKILWNWAVPIKFVPAYLLRTCLPFKVTGGDEAARIVNLTNYGQSTTSRKGTSTQFDAQLKASGLNTPYNSYGTF